MSSGGGSDPGCAVCGHGPVETFFSLSDVPVWGCTLYRSQEEARAVPRGTLRLVFCPGCGAIWNAAFDERVLSYTEAYENALHYSPAYAAYERELVDELIDRYELRGRAVLEIGCGDGHFLSLLCGATGSRGIGYDPAHDPLKAGDLPPGVTIVRDLFPPEAAADADFVCCRYVLEHLADPVGFLRGLRAALGARRDVRLYFEVPNTVFVLRGRILWRLLYEHRSYFTPPSLRALFERSGFEVLELGSSFGEQYVRVVAAPVGERVSPEGAARDPEVTGLERLVGGFAAGGQELLERWEEGVRRLRQEGRSLAVWGAGSTGVMFMNLVSAAGEAAWLIDINPRKHGLYVPGVATRVRPPDELIDLRPTDVLVMNEVYEQEIRASLAAMGLAADVFTV